MDLSAKRNVYFPTLQKIWHLVVRNVSRSNACTSVQRVILILHGMVSPFCPLTLQAKTGTATLAQACGLLSLAVLSLVKINTECFNGRCEEYRSAPAVLFLPPRFYSSCEQRLMFSAKLQVC